MVEVCGIDFSDGLPAVLHSKANGEVTKSYTLVGGRYELMQYTGLHDKNGKEIYEGDIVEWQSGDDVSRMAVHFRVEYGRCMTIPYINSKCEVIGNIHESPELLA